MRMEQYGHFHKVAPLETILGFIFQASVIFYAYFYFSSLLSLFLHSRSVLLFRSSSRETWIKKLVLHSFPQNEGGRKADVVARQQSSNLVLNYLSSSCDDANA
jgi:hypothetical protein